METLLKIDNDELIFDEETHTYWYDGKKCISVTQILHTINPDKYKGIDSEVLKKAANRGNEIHNAIEVYETLGLEREDLKEFRDYQFLKKYYKFKVVAVEKPILIRYKGLVVAGRLDGILKEPTEEGERTCLYDIKTTSQLDLEYLSKQESLYKYGLNQIDSDINIDGLRAIHLRKGVRKYVVIEQCDAEEILEEYIRIKEEEENGKINNESN
jgi:hypothetical protein